MANGEDAGSKTLDRGLRLLRLIGSSPDGLTVTEMARSLGVHRAAVYRLLHTLEAHELVAKMKTGYRIGAGAIALAGSVQPDLQSAAMPQMEQLAKEFGATATLTVRIGDEAAAIAVAEPHDVPLHVSYRVGFRHPVTRGASGIALLAGSPPTPEESSRVRKARRRGWASTRGELEPGAHGLAAAIPAPGGGEAIASIGLVALSPFDEAVAGPRLRAAAESIAADVYQISHGV